MDAVGCGVPPAASRSAASTIAWSFAASASLVTLVASSPRPCAPRACRRSPRCATSPSTGRRVVEAAARRRCGSFSLVGVALVIAAARRRRHRAVAGLGALLTIVGVVVLGPVVARPAARARRAARPPARHHRLAGPRRTRCATRGAPRHRLRPDGRRRASSRCSPCFAASVKARSTTPSSKQFAGDLVINTDGFSGAGLSPQLATDIAELPQVQTAVGARDRHDDDRPRRRPT